MLSQPGISSLIVLEGINDVGFPHLKPRLPNGTLLKDLPFTHEAVSAEDLIVGLQQIIDRGPPTWNQGVWCDSDTFRRSRLLQ